MKEPVNIRRINPNELHLSDHQYEIRNIVTGPDDYLIALQKDLKRRKERKPKTHCQKVAKEIADSFD